MSEAESRKVLEEMVMVYEGVDYTDLEWLRNMQRAWRWLWGHCSDKYGIDQGKLTATLSDIYDMDLPGGVG